MSPLEAAFWERIGTAVLCGGIVGLERQTRDKPAGIRTSILICLGTQLFVQLGSAVGPEGVDPTRVLGQVVTGIGFLGAGVILARGEIVVGVTTAAVIWVLAGIGAAIGLGHYLGAIATTLVAVGVLTGVELAEELVRKARRGARRSEPS